MCGIAGLVERKEKNINWVKVTKNISEQIKNRGPDDEGYLFLDQNKIKIFGGNSTNLRSKLNLNFLPQNHIDTALLHSPKLVFIHRRLSILDLSDAGHQPMSDPQGKVWIIYNGEIYNFQQIRQQLETKGYKFRTNTDTEVVLYSYLEWGPEALEKFNGMFAFAILDLRQQKIFLARDRIGIKPLFYYMNKERFIFASNARAIVFSSLYEKQINWEAVWYNFAYGFSIKPLSVFKNVYMLDPAHYIIYDLQNHKILKRNYWKISSPKNKINSLQLAIKEFQQIFESSIKYRLIADVEVATFLSGGIDSGLLTTFANKFHPGIKAFTLSFSKEDRFNQELERSILTAKRNNINQIITFTQPQQIIDQIDKIIEGYEEPYPQMAPTYMLAKSVKEQNIKIVQVGLGGDELFAGYGYYKNIPRWTLLKHLYRLNHFFVADILKKIKIIYNRKPKDWAEIYGLMFMKMPDKLIAKLFFNDLNYDSLNALKKYLNPYNLTFNSPVEVYNYYDIMLFLGSHNLYHSDQFFMDNSIESRVPFLDHRLVEFSFKLSPKLKIKFSPFNSQTKYLLRRFALNYLPKQVIYGKKYGFNLPVRQWLENKLKDFSDQVINELKASKILDPKGIDAILKLNIKLHKWHLIMFYLWYKKFIYS